jgi:hypothetical protein
LVSDIPAGDGNIKKLSYGVWLFKDHKKGLFLFVLDSNQRNLVVIYRELALSWRADPTRRSV